MASDKQKEHILDIVPCRRQDILTEKEGDRVVIAYPRFRHAWMQKFLLPKGMSPYIRVRLEQHGSVVWENIDGRSTVQEILDRLAGHFESEANYDARIITYLYQLEKDGFISFFRLHT